MTDDAMIAYLERRLLLLDELLLSNFHILSGVHKYAEELQRIKNEFGQSDTEEG